MVEDIPKDAKKDLNLTGFFLIPQTCIEYLHCAMPCTATDLGNIKIRNGPYPQEVFSLVNLSPFSSSLPHLPG